MKESFKSKKDELDELYKNKTQELCKSIKKYYDKMVGGSSDHKIGNIKVLCDEMCKSYYDKINKLHNNKMNELYFNIY